MEASGLRDILDSSEPVIIFALTDKAYAVQSNGTLEMLINPDSRARLQSILHNHPVQGRIGTGAAFKVGSVTTEGGEVLNFEILQGMF